MTIQEQQDREIVRNLAQRVAELAASDEYEVRRKRWRDVNGLRKPDRAPVWCRPAGAWKEILPEDALQCQDPLCRGVERTLRQHLFKDEVGDDHIVEPWWGVGAVFDRDIPYTWGMRTGKLVASTSLGGWRYEPSQHADGEGRLQACQRHVPCGPPRWGTGPGRWRGTSFRGKGGSHLHILHFRFRPALRHLAKRSGMGSRARNSTDDDDQQTGSRPGDLLPGPTGRR